MEEERNMGKYRDGSYHPFAAFVTNLGKYNEGTLEGRWVTFPTTQEELRTVLDSIGIGVSDESGHVYEEWFIADYEWYATEGTPGFLGNHESLDELNYLAVRLREMGEGEYDQFQAIVEMGNDANSLRDMINLMDNLDCYDVHPDIGDEDDLGRYYATELAKDVPEELRNYIDYEEYGRDMSINEAGSFTRFGYVRRNGSPAREYYDGRRESIPEEFRITPERGWRPETVSKSVAGMTEKEASEENPAVSAVREQAKKDAARWVKHAMPSLAR